MATLGGSTPPMEASITVLTRTPVAPTVSEKSLVSLGTGSPIAQSVVIHLAAAVLVGDGDEDVGALELAGDEEPPQAVSTRPNEARRTGTAIRRGLRTPTA
jgi:hypothetical protein